MTMPKMPLEEVEIQPIDDETFSLWMLAYYLLLQEKFGLEAVDRFRRDIEKLTTRGVLPPPTFLRTAHNNGYYYTLIIERYSRRPTSGTASLGDMELVDELVAQNLAELQHIERLVIPAPEEVS